MDEYPMTLDQLIAKLTEYRNLYNKGDEWVTLDGDLSYVVGSVGFDKGNYVSITSIETPEKLDAHPSDPRDKYWDNVDHLYDENRYYDEVDEDEERLEYEAEEADRLVQEYLEEGVKRW